MPESRFGLPQATRLAEAFAAEGVDYLFIGKGGAILLGCPETTQDVDIFLPRSRENAERVLRALQKLGFQITPMIYISVIAGSEFIIFKDGPFDLDLCHAPDGIESFEAAKARGTLEDGRFPVASLDDIIASKRAAGREKDLVALPNLERFRVVYHRWRQQRQEAGGHSER